MLLRTFTLHFILLWAMGFITPAISQIPSSIRSKKAISIQTPILTAQLKAKGLELSSPVFIRIFKDEKILEVWVKKSSRFELFKSYKICTFSGMLGTKKIKGDGQAPEGFYTIYPNHLNPTSSYHLSLNIGYPNTYDRAHGYTGSHIMIHGNCVSIGCFAMTDPYIEEIYTLVHKAFEGGQKLINIHIFPFKLTEQNLNLHKDLNKWNSFWKNLKVGYDYFEKTKTPPMVSVKNKVYVFK